MRPQFSHRDPERNQAIAARLEQLGVDLALRGDKLRLSPHLYNGGADVDLVLEHLNDLA